MKSLAPLALLAALTIGCAAEAGSPSSDVKDSQPAPNSISAATAPLPDEDAAAEAALFESANRSRQQVGVGPLRMDESLRLAARLHAQRMADTQRLEHQLPGEPALLQRIAEASSLPLDRAGENIAYAACAVDAHQLLMNSPRHRENIVDPTFNVVGIAAIRNRGRIYVVQDFARIMPSLSARETRTLVGHAIAEVRANAGLPQLEPVPPHRLDEAACRLASEDHPNAHLVAAFYPDRKVITYTQSNPEIIPPRALSLLSNFELHNFAIGSCYARNRNYPTGIYWVAILLN